MFTITPSASTSGRPRMPKIPEFEVKAYDLKVTGVVWCYKVLPSSLSLLAMPLNQSCSGMSVLSDELSKIQMWE